MDKNKQEYTHIIPNGRALRQLVLVNLLEQARWEKSPGEGPRPVIKPKVIPRMKSEGKAYPNLYSIDKSGKIRWEYIKKEPDEEMRSDMARYGVSEVGDVDGDDHLFRSEAELKDYLGMVQKADSAYVRDTAKVLKAYELVHPRPLLASGRMRALAYGMDEEDEKRLAGFVLMPQTARKQLGVNIGQYVHVCVDGGNIRERLMVGKANKRLVSGQARADSELFVQLSKKVISRLNLERSLSGKPNMGWVVVEKINGGGI